jgi:hypothetical protein
VAVPNRLVVEVLLLVESSMLLGRLDVSVYPVFAKLYD